MPDSAPTKEIEFPAPKGFAPPEDAEPGKSFEVMATVRMTDGGKICLEALDGAPISEEEKNETPEAEKAEDGSSDNSFLGAIEKGMSSSGAK